MNASAIDEPSRPRGQTAPAPAAGGEQVDPTRCALAVLSHGAEGRLIASAWALHRNKTAVGR